MPQQLLIHIGYHKTATTWMQRQLFQPVHGYRQICGHQEVFDLIVKPHGLRFDPAPMQALISRGIESLAKGEVPVISSEILSGHPFQGGARKRCLCGTAATNRSGCADSDLDPRSVTHPTFGLYAIYIARWHDAAFGVFRRHTGTGLFCLHT